MTATANFVRLARCLAIIAATLVLVALTCPIAANAAAGAYFVPGNPKLGMRLFFEKGCTRCHAVLGEGGRSAPDLARAPAGHLSAAELVAAMWNHAPAMWHKMRLQNLELPKFTPAEMTDLFAFLYSVRSLDEPGDPQRGRKLVEEKKCLSCHAIGGQGGGPGADLRRWASYRNPVSWVQAMWNHGGAMQAMMAQRGVGWPQFQAGDMADLIAYVRTVAAASGPRAALKQADPESGRRIFAQKRCDACHTIRSSGTSRGPDLGARSLPRTLGQFAGMMWNHAPAMWSSMSAQGVARPQFSNQEMADLIAYLFTQRYFEASGNADRGHKLFEEKGCGGCHGGSGAAPDLAKSKGAASPVAMAATLWNHGPMMFTSMQKRQLEWPRFKPGEIADIMEFLNRAAPAPIQSAQNKRSQP